LLLGIAPKLDLPVGKGDAGAVTHFIVKINPSRTNRRALLLTGYEKNGWGKTSS